MAAPGSPDIRGSDRRALLNDLAHGMTGVEAAAKYSRHEQSIKEFRVRNAGEISVIRAGINAELHQRLSEVEIADKALRIANYGRLRDDLLAKLDDPGLSLVDRNRLTKTAMALNRHVAEEMGDLRSHVEVTAHKNVLNDFTEFVIDDDGTFHPLAGSNVDGPESGASGQ